MRSVSREYQSCLRGNYYAADNTHVIILHVLATIHSSKKLSMITDKKLCHISFLSTFEFLDTQVSLEPTPVSWLVGQLVTLSDFQSLVSNGRSNKKIKKTKSIYFQILFLGGTSP